MKTHTTLNLAHPPPSPRMSPFTLSLLSNLPTHLLPTPQSGPELNSQSHIPTVRIIACRVADSAANAPLLLRSMRGG